MNFLDLFQPVRHRRVGGGSKSCGADEMTWRSRLPGHPLVIRTRPRQNKANATFFISSNQRLRTSGHTDAEFIDVEVLEGRLAARERRGLEELVQAADTLSRPARVRAKGGVLR